MLLPKVVNVRLLTVVMLAFFALTLAGCGNSWNPFSPITDFWEKMTERAGESGDGANAVPESVQPEPEATLENPEPVTEVKTEEPGDPESSTGEEEPSDGNKVPSNFSGVHWLHADVSGWKETGNLSSVKVSGGMITLNYDKARSWPGKNHAGANVNANPWIFVYRDGTWYAGTWEWLRHGQTSKSVRSVNGDHIKKSPLNSFSPRSGERYGFMVSGLARDKARNVRERTNVVMYTWP